MLSKRVLLVPVLCLLVSAASELPDRSSTGSRPAEPRHITLAFVGDIMAHTENLSSTPYEAAYADVSERLSSADLAFANFEFVVDTEQPPAGYPRFNAPPAYAEAAFAAGIDVVSAANNHAADLGIDGIIHTRSVLDHYRETLGIVSSGIVADPESRFAPELIEIGDVRIGFLAVTSFLNRGFITDHVNIASFTKEADREMLLERIRETRSCYDLFVLSYHGGTEYASEPDERKREFFGELVEAGVDIVWGHHPHVLQPLEVSSRDGAQAVIMYSLGNFLSGQSSYLDASKPDDERAPRGESAIVTVTVALPESGGASIESVDAVPVVHIPDSRGKVRVLELDSIERSDTMRRWQEFYRIRGESLRKWVAYHLPTERDTVVR